MTILIDEPVLPASVRALPRPIPKGRPRQRTIKERLNVAVASVLGECFGPREAQAFGILMYHRVVDPPPRKVKPTWNVPPWLFERQLTGLLNRGWQAWPLKQVFACLERDLPIPRKTFVVTFDDGYANNFTQAYEILTRLHVPATLFLATAYLDSPRPFPSDDWIAAGQPGTPSEAWRPLTTDECERLIANGLVELGAHTHTHADFRGQPEAFAEDLGENLAVLRERFGVEQPAFAFPYGTRSDGFASEELTRMVRESGASCALSTEAELVRRGDSPFTWGRFAAEDHDSARSLAARLGGWTGAIRRMARMRARAKG